MFSLLLKDLFLDNEHFILHGFEAHTPQNRVLVSDLLTSETGPPDPLACGSALGLCHPGSLVNHFLQRADHTMPFGLAPFRHQWIRVFLDIIRRIRHFPENLGSESSKRVYSQESRTKIRAERGMRQTEDRTWLALTVRLAPGVGFEPTRPARTTG